MVAAWCNVVEQRVQPPAPGHSSLETMTQQDYSNDLVFRSSGEEYAHVDGSKEWKTQTPATKLEISATDNEEDVTKLVEHVADMVDGVSVTVKPGGSIKMTGDAKITMTGGAIKIG
jgi:hypothetical protein